MTSFSVFVIALYSMKYLDHSNRTPPLNLKIHVSSDLLVCVFCVFVFLCVWVLVFLCITLQSQYDFVLKLVISIKTIVCVLIVVF